MKESNVCGLYASAELVFEMLYGHLTPEEAVDLDKSYRMLDEETLKKAILVRAHNVCERLLSKNVLKF